MKDVLILIPPSEGKKPGGNSPGLKNPSSEVSPMLDQIFSVKDAQWEKILGVKGKALEKAVKSNKDVLCSATMRAIERYTGVVYNGIDYFSLKSTERKYFDKHVCIISALFGLVKPQDLIPDYKLKIDKLGADKYWRPLLEKKLKNKFVIDLLPKAHKKAIAYKEGIEIEFCLMKDGKIVPAGHQGKLIKGKFVRWLVRKQSFTLKSLRSFTEDGFSWDGKKYVKSI